MVCINILRLLVNLEKFDGKKKIRESLYLVKRKSQRKIYKGKLGEKIIKNK